MTLSLRRLAAAATLGLASAFAVANDTPAPAQSQKIEAEQEVSYSVIGARKIVSCTSDDKAVVSFIRVGVDNNYYLKNQDTKTGDEFLDKIDLVANKVMRGFTSTALSTSDEDANRLFKGLNDTINGAEAEMIQKYGASFTWQVMGFGFDPEFDSDCASKPRASTAPNYSIR